MITDNDQPGVPDDRTPAPERDVEPGCDLEYDLAHDADTTATTLVADQPRPAGDTVHVIPRDLDLQGDYGYDLAHEVICQ
jgi:hypothetical protein